MNGLSTLAKQQNDLLKIIFATNNIALQAINTPAIVINSTSNRGILAYQANAAASAVRSLQSAYPVTAQLIGDEAFAHLARDFWAHHPPERGDLAQWGSELSIFITSIQALQTEPYLSDVALAEWALHTATIAADKTENLASFSLLAEQDPESVTLDLASGLTQIHSAYPLASLLAAHLYADVPDSPSFDDVGQKLRDGTPEIALIWRHGLRPRVAVCGVAEAEFLSNLRQGKSLLVALDAAMEVTNMQANRQAFDFATWLPQAVSQGLILGAMPI